VLAAGRRAPPPGRLPDGEQVAGQLGRPGQADQVAARQHVRIDAEPLPRERPLEPDGKEPVVGAGHHPDGDLRPCAEVAARPERRVGFWRLVCLAGRGDVRRNVVQKVNGQVDLP
jgi:hypothetical protein